MTSIIVKLKVNTEKPISDGSILILSDINTIQLVSSRNETGR